MRFQIGFVPADKIPAEKQIGLMRKYFIVEPYIQAIIICNLSVHGMYSIFQKLD